MGRDTRTSGVALACALQAGVMASGSDVVDLGILPTPALQYIVVAVYGQCDGDSVPQSS